ncbi:MAG: hypothetical protein JW747_08540 [Candidatus Aminicenantes bacterium]|nr:hypothetical protein [Candidatus Aminicenantes bacterium]
MRIGGRDRRKGRAILAAAFLAFAAGRAAAEEPYLGAAVDWNSRYIWRGMTVHDGAVFQPSVWTSFLGTNLLVWANSPLQAGDGQKGFDEINFYFQGTSPRRALVVVTGLNVYTYPRAEDAERWTAEVAMTFYAPVGPAWLYWENSVDVISTPGAYYSEFGIQMGRDVADNLSVEAALAQSYASNDFNDAYLGIAKSAFTYLTAQVGIEWRIADLLSVTPHMEAVFTLDSDVRREWGAAVRTNFGLTLTLGYD